MTVQAMLTGCRTYMTGGIIYLKDKIVEVEEEVASKLEDTGLFKLIVGKKKTVLVTKRTEKTAEVPDPDEPSVPV